MFKSEWNHFGVGAVVGRETAILLCGVFLIPAAPIVSWEIGIVIFQQELVGPQFGGGLISLIGRHCSVIRAQLPRLSPSAPTT